jgi:hypothetical protein
MSAWRSKETSVFSLTKTSKGASASYTNQPVKAVVRFRGKPTEHLKEEFMRFSRENLLRPEEVAAVLGSTPKTLANWRCEHRGPPFLKIGRQAFYPLDSLNRWLDQQEYKQTKGNKYYATRK